MPHGCGASQRKALPDEVSKQTKDTLTMAKVSAHGQIIGTVDYLTKSKRYMSDGVILLNGGFGWKLGGKVKPGIEPCAAYENAKARLAAKLEASAALYNYRKLLHEMAGVGKRWKLHMAISMMPDDPDGVWSEACDGYGENIHADVDEVSELCAAYRLAMNVRED